MSVGFDDFERKFGISAYASPHEGFAAVLKARYSDFVVHEVDSNGAIARLENLEIPQPVVAKVEAPAESVTDTGNESTQENTKKRKLSEGASLPVTDSAADDKFSNEEQKQKELKTDWDSHRQSLSKLIGETPAQEFVSFLKQYETDAADKPIDGNDQKFYTLPLISDKQIRRSIHMLIKSPAFNSMALADNHEGRIRIWHKKFESDMPKDTHWGGGGNARNSKNNGKGNKRGGGNQTPWPRDRPDFLRFVLYKENIDTGTAAKDIGRYAKLNPKRGISYAGMKDKRGITTQFCSAYRVEKEKLLAVNARGGNASGGGNTVTNGACIIKVGNFAYSSNEVKLGALSGNRFDIVLRNVDIGGDIKSSSQHIVQQRLENAGNALRMNGFINYFGMQRFGKFHDTHEVGIAILKGDFEGAVGIIMREKTDETPRIAESRRQWARRFLSIDVLKNEDAARDAERKCARDILNNIGRFMVCEKSIVDSLSRKPRDYKRAFCSIAKNMRSMFLHAYQSYLWNMVASHRIETGGSTQVRAGDLVLIEDKPSGSGGSGTSGLKGKSVKLLGEQDLKDGKFSITDVVLPLAGSKIIYPGGSSGQMFEELMKKDGINKADLARIRSVDRELFLGGDYRKLICKPSDVSFEVKAYKDPLQPLLQTDLMKATGVEITAITLTANNEDGKSHQLEGNQGDNVSKTIFGMIVGFSLPPSAYATIAVRELTKRPTSSEYQSKLEVSGECERNIVRDGNGSP